MEQGSNGSVYKALLGASPLVRHTSILNWMTHDDANICTVRPCSFLAPWEVPGSIRAATKLEAEATVDHLGEPLVRVNLSQMP